MGESLAALPLIEKLLDGGNCAGDQRHRHQRQRCWASACRQARIHQFVPLDTPGAVARFLDHWRPDAGLFVESDLWPNLILAARGARREAGAGQCPHLGTLGGAAGGACPARPRALLGAFDAVLAQDEEIAARFRGLGARNVQVVGSLKADAPPLACDDDALAALKAADRRAPGAARGPDPSRRGRNRAAGA